MRSLTSRSALLGFLALASTFSTPAFAATPSPTLASSTATERSVQETIHISMFGYAPGTDGGFFLERTPQERGSFSGFNGHGSPFHAELEDVTRLDLDDPAFLEQLDDRERHALLSITSMHSFLGYVRNGNAGHEVGGVIVETRTPFGYVTELKPAALRSDLAFLLDTNPEEVIPACQERSLLIPVWELPDDCPFFEELCFDEYEEAIANAADAFSAAAEAAAEIRDDLAQEYEFAQEGVTSIVNDYIEQLGDAWRFFGLSAESAGTFAILSALDSNFDAEMGALVELMGGSIDELTDQYNEAMDAATSTYQADAAEALQDLLACLELYGDLQPECAPVLYGWWMISWSCGEGLRIEFRFA